MAEMPGLQVVRHVSHLVKERIQALGSVPCQHQIEVESNLLDAALSIGFLARQHVAER
jgi:hypothetical protein